MSYEFIEKGGRLYLSFKRLKDAGLFNVMTTYCMDFRYFDDKGESLSRIRGHLSDIYGDFGISPKALFAGYQKHTANVGVVDSLDCGRDYHYSRVLEETDAIVTDMKDVALITKFADCTPVLIYDPIKRVHANIHSGWRGTCAHISSNAIRQMVRVYGSRPEELLVAIGPTLGADDFEIRDDCLEVFIDSFDDISDKITVKGKGYYNLDLQGIIVDELISLGVKCDNIDAVKLSTLNDERFHSYRRMGNDYSLMSMISMLF